LFTDGKMGIYQAFYKSPIGLLKIISDGTSILSCNFVEEERRISKEMPKIIVRTFTQFEEFFRKERKNFDVPIAPAGTDFQQKVWRELLHVPYGKTITYKELASRIGQEKAVRAVGNANGKNPISIIIPCHRVIGSDGNLVGYGGGLDRKKWLLEFERN